MATLKLIHAFEMLDAIEAETEPYKKMKLVEQYGSVSPLNYILSLNFNHSIKLSLAEGMPALDPKHMDMHTHPDFQGLLAGSIARLRYCIESCEAPQIKKDQIFYDTLINCPLKDAEILCSAKDHALEELYPSITSALVAAVFPQYVG